MTTTRLVRIALLAPGALALGLMALAPAWAAAAPAHRGAATPAAHRRPSPPISVRGSRPTPAVLSEGRTLFDENCSSCHGINGQGGALAPNLRGLGPGVAYLWVSSGWMPLANPTSEPIRKPSLFTEAQTVAISEYVGSLGHGGTPIYDVNLANADERVGLDVFALNCAGCHTITGMGDAISDGQFAPTLHDVTSTQTAIAVRTGPGNMPTFGPKVISDAQLADVARYIQSAIRHPDNAGGLGLGGIGPVAEGFVALFIGVGACVVGALWIGDRAEPEEAGEHGHDGGAHGTGDSELGHD